MFIVSLVFSLDFLRLITKLEYTSSSLLHLKIPKIETNANEVKFSNEKLLLFYLIFAQIEIIEIYRQKG